MNPRAWLLPVLLVALAMPAAAQQIVFTAFLDGPSESPPNASPGTGFARVTWDMAANTMRVETDFSGLIAGVTAAHIHVINGPGDGNTSDTVGPVATQLPTFPGFPSGVTAGSYDATFDMTLASSYNTNWINNSGGTVAQARAQLFAGLIDGRAYLNIHTQQFPGGEIRGFLAAVPGPAAALAFLAPLCRLRRRRRR